MHVTLTTQPNSRTRICRHCQPAPHLHIKDEALQRQAQVGREVPQHQTSLCVALVGAALAVVAVVPNQFLWGQSSGLKKGQGWMGPGDAGSRQTDTLAQVQADTESGRWAVEQAGK